jgi:hypothetical protein
VCATPETIPVPDWHREIIDERGKELDVDPDAGGDWDVRQQVHIADSLHQTNFVHRERNRNWPASGYSFADADQLVQIRIVEVRQSLLDCPT